MFCIDAHGYKLLSLVMIVKNEAKSIQKTIHSVRGIVDRYTILDTGSTDATVSLIKDAFGDIPGDIFHESFIDFSTSRNRVIELEGQKSKFALMLSGDETLYNGNYLREYLTNADAKDINMYDSAFNIKVIFGDEFDYWSTRIHHTGYVWRYRGVTHEYMEHRTGYVTQVSIPNVRIRHNVYANNRLDRRARWLEDEKLLLREWERVNTPRYAFYLGQTYQNLENWSKSFKWYQVRCEMAINDDEEFEACYRLVVIAENMGKSWPHIKGLLENAMGYKPPRAEPYYDIAYHYYEEQNWTTAFDYLIKGYNISIPTNIKTQIRYEIYEYSIPDLLGTVAYFVGERSIGKEAVLKALKYKPNDVRLLRNLEYYTEL
jgi:glycosyltransferase involved in cell wall biosynthesis